MAISDYLRGLRERIGHDLVHLPAVCVLIWDDDGRLLLMREAETGRWQTVGGMIDPDESPWDAAAREAARILDKQRPDDVSVERLIESCETSLEEPPDSSWDGTVRLKTKG